MARKQLHHRFHNTIAAEVIIQGGTGAPTPHHGTPSWWTTQVGNEIFSVFFDDLDEAKAFVKAARVALEGLAAELDANQ